MKISPEQRKEKLSLLFYENFRADEKLIDSYALILKLANELGISNDFYPFLISDACQKHFFFVLKISSRDYVRTRLSFLTWKIRFQYLIFDKVDFIQANFLDRALDKLK
ncbi:MAG: hypothetical protein ACPG19_05000 [Saprospiraceae bacterium]